MLVRTLALTLAAAGLMVPVSAPPAAAAVQNFTPKPGPTFNNPLGSSADQKRIHSRIVRSVNSVPRGENIDIFSWNFLSPKGADALLRAQRRGVRVRLIMDDTNVKQRDNPPFKRLRSSLARYNRNHPRQRNSWARLCQGTCRSTRGSAHSKFFMFSDVGRTKRVVMQGSANFTVASTTNQWNDVYTHARHRGVWKFYSRIFSQAAKDKPVRPPYRDKQFKNFRLIAFPNKGKRVPDPVMQVLNRTSCRGATNTSSGRTKIQIAPDVIRQNRGMKLARKLRGMWNNGCNIRIGYTVVGIDVGRYLRQGSGRGPVPMKHLVQDRNGDGEFDKYFHMKSMTIRGNYHGDRSGYLLLNGSANWSSTARVSDENIGIYRNRKRVKRYEEHLDYWYNRFPRRPSSSSSATDTLTERRIDDGQLIFGGGRNAVYENGESVTDGEFDPFASMEE